MASQIQTNTVPRAGHWRMGVLSLAVMTALCIFVANIWRQSMFNWTWSGVLAIASIPIAVLSLFGHRSARALVFAFLPPVLAGAIANLAWDHPFALLVAPTVLWITCLVTALSSPDLRRRLVANQGRCGDCGYDLTGNQSGTCPECAEPVGPVAGRRPWGTLLLTLLLWVVGAAAGIGLFVYFACRILSQPI